MTLEPSEFAQELAVNMKCLCGGWECEFDESRAAEEIDEWIKDYVKAAEDYLYLASTADLPPSRKELARVRKLVKRGTPKEAKRDARKARK